MVTDMLTKADRIPRVRSSADFFARLAVANTVRGLGFDPLAIDLQATARNFALTRGLTLSQVPASIGLLRDEDLCLR